MRPGKKGRSRARALAAIAIVVSAVLAALIGGANVSMADIIWTLPTGS